MKPHIGKWGQLDLGFTLAEYIEANDSVLRWLIYPERRLFTSEFAPGSAPPVGNISNETSVYSKPAVYAGHRGPRYITNTSRLLYVDMQPHNSYLLKFSVAYFHCMEILIFFDWAYPSFDQIRQSNQKMDTPLKIINQLDF